MASYSVLIFNQFFSILDFPGPLMERSWKSSGRKFFSVISIMPRLLFCLKQDSELFAINIGQRGTRQRRTMVELGCIVLKDTVGKLILKEMYYCIKGNGLY